MECISGTSWLSSDWILSINSGSWAILYIYPRSTKKIPRFLGGFASVYIGATRPVRGNSDRPFWPFWSRTWPRQARISPEYPASCQDAGNGMPVSRQAIPLYTHSRPRLYAASPSSGRYWAWSSVASRSPFYTLSYIPWSQNSRNHYVVNAQNTIS